MSTRPLPLISMKPMHFDFYIKYNDVRKKTPGSMHCLQLGLYAPKEISTGLWMTEVYIAREDKPGVPLFSTFIYCEERWFDPALCKVNRFCDLESLNYVITLSCDLHIQHWDNCSGYMDNFILKVRSSAHQDLYKGVTHEGVGTKKPGNMHMVWYKQVIHLEDLQGYSLSCTMHRDFYHRQYKMYYLNNLGLFTRAVTGSPRTEKEVDLLTDVSSFELDSFDYDEDFDSDDNPKF